MVLLKVQNTHKKKNNKLYTTTSFALGRPTERDAYCMMGTNADALNMAHAEAAACRFSLPYSVSHCKYIEIYKDKRYIAGYKSAATIKTVISGS